MSVYLPYDKNNKDSFMDILGIEKPVEIDHKKFKVFKIPPATYAEFNCTYQTAAKINKYIYGEWLPSAGFYLNTFSRR